MVSWNCLVTVQTCSYLFLFYFILHFCFSGNFISHVFASCVTVLHMSLLPLHSAGLLKKLSVHFDEIVEGWNIAEGKIS